jgi:hypothetical protein
MTNNDADLRDTYELLGLDSSGDLKEREEESHDAFTCDECRAQAKRLAGTTDGPTPSWLEMRSRHFAGEELPGVDERGDTPQVDAKKSDEFDGDPREAGWLGLLDALEDFYRNGPDGGEGGPCDMEGRDVLLTGDLDSYGDPIVRVEMDGDYSYDLWS